MDAETVTVSHTGDLDRSPGRRGGDLMPIRRKLREFYPID